jgi:ribonuclease HII
VLKPTATYPAGCDEAGRGPLAGPVIAAVVMLHPDKTIPALADSKQLSASKRTYLAQIIKAQAVGWAVAAASVQEIDTINVLQATLLAMRRAVNKLPQAPCQLLVDGKQLPQNLPCPAEAIIRGDQTVPSISAASILAKTYRDGLMIKLDYHFPQYGFKQHKGYGTSQHLAALKKWGVTPVHRRSFAPIKQLLQNAS